MRIASMLAVASLFTALGSGCAVDHDSNADLDSDTPGVAAMAEDLGGGTGEDDPGKLQAPPVKLKTAINDVPFLAMFALKDAVGSFPGQMEHWFASPVQTAVPLTTTSITIRAYPLADESESSMFEWAAPLAPSFSCPREVKASDWRRGSVILSAGQAGHLYWTQHPDNTAEMLGLLLITDRDNHVVSTAWYRSFAPDTSGRAFTSSRWSRTLYPVTNSAGQPSIDPNDIRNADWYSIVMAP